MLPELQIPPMPCAPVLSLAIYRAAVQGTTGTYDFRLVLMAVEGLSGQSGADRWRSIAFDANALAFIRIPSGGAVMLHLMQPAKAVGRLVGECGEAGFDTQQVGLNDKLEAISSARVAAKFHLDLKALTGADRNSNLGVKPQ